MQTWDIFAQMLRRKLGRFRKLSLDLCSLRKNAKRGVRRQFENEVGRTFDCLGILSRPSLPLICARPEIQCPLRIKDARTSPFLPRSFPSSSPFYCILIVYSVPLQIMQFYFPCKKSKCFFKLLFLPVARLCTTESLLY